jgi:hypothetical protein
MCVLILANVMTPTGVTVAHVLTYPAHFFVETARVGSLEAAVNQTLTNAHPTRLIAATAIAKTSKVHTSATVKPAGQRQILLSLIPNVPLTSTNVRPGCHTNQVLHKTVSAAIEVTLAFNATTACTAHV